MRINYNKVQKFYESALNFYLKYIEIKISKNYKRSQIPPEGKYPGWH